MTKVRHYQAVFPDFPIVKYPVNPTSFPDYKYITQINKENTVHAGASLLESPIRRKFYLVCTPHPVFFETTHYRVREDCQKCEAYSPHYTDT